MVKAIAVHDKSMVRGQYPFQSKGWWKPWNCAFSYSSWKKYRNHITLDFHWCSLWYGRLPEVRVGIIVVNKYSSEETSRDSMMTIVLSLSWAISCVTRGYGCQFYLYRNLHLVIVLSEYNRSIHFLIWLLLKWRYWATKINGNMPKRLVINQDIKHKIGSSQRASILLYLLSPKMHLHIKFQQHSWQLWIATITSPNVSFLTTQ